MRDLPRVSEVRYRPAHAEQRASGLHGWVDFVLADAVRFAGVAVRRANNGRWTLSFACRRDERGVRHYYAHPYTNEVRAAITSQVVAHLRLGAHAR